MGLPVRTHNNQLQAATWTYIHRATGCRLQLIGMSHIGDAAFYHEVLRRINDHLARGGVVHYERVIPISDEQLAGLSADERSKIERGRNRKLRTKLAHVLGLIDQSELVKPEPSWVNTDMNELELIRLLGTGKVGPGSWLNRLLENSLGRKAVKVIGRKLLRYSAPIYNLQQSLVSILPKAEKTMEVLVYDRNDIGLAAAQSHLSSDDPADLLVYWGAGHLPDLNRSFKRLGFERVGEEWLTVINFQH